MTTFLSNYFSGERLLQDENDTVFDPCAEENIDTSSDLTYTVAINVLVFFTVWGISSVVDAEEFKKSFRKPAIYAGVAFQFILMPFIGFLAVLIFPLEPLQAVTLLVLTASPGGSFSNWWCNLFNADLALSVSMTSLSTVASVAMLPLNVVIYITFAFERTQDFEGDDVEVSFLDLGITLGTVITAILLGLTTGFLYPQYQKICNIIGNVSGGASIMLGVFASADTCDGKAPWEQAFFPLWVATAFPLLVALIGVLIMGSFLGLEKPQRVAIALETAYQNSGIALAYSLSQGVEGRRAAGVPVIYGGYEAGFFFLFMVGSWKAGWTYAPKDDNLFKVLFDNYQPGGDNHKKLFPGMYPVRSEAESFSESVRKSMGKRLSFGKKNTEKEVEIKAELAAESKGTVKAEVVETSAEETKEISKQEVNVETEDEKKADALEAQDEAAPAADKKSPNDKDPSVSL